MKKLLSSNLKKLSEEKNFQKIANFWRILDDKTAPARSFLTIHRAVILGAFLALVTIFYFTSIAYFQELFNIFPALSIRQAGVWSVFLVAIISAIGSWFGSKNWLNFIFIWIQSSFLSFFTFSYFLGIENRNFYPILFAVLPVLVFLVNLDLFGRQKYYHFTLFSQVLLFAVQTFSLLNFFNADRISTRDFQENILSRIFSLNPIFWLILCTFAVTLVTLAYLKIDSLVRNLVFGSILFLLIGQILWLSESFDFRNSLYWQKSLLFIVVWDFLISPLQNISSNKSDDKYNPKLIVSTFYHSFLVIIVTIFSII
jgi:hypothetical protein